MWEPYKTNILIEPEDKNKVIGNTQTKYLYGKVLAVGSEVGTFKFLWWNIKRKNAIKKGDTLGFTQWGTNKIVMADGKEHYFIADNPEFILGVKNE